MRFTNRMRVNGELAARSLSKKAKEVYEGTDPFDIYEYEVWVDDENQEKRYAYTGCLGEAEDLTFEELEEALEELADEDLEDTEEDSSLGLWGLSMCINSLNNINNILR